MKERSIESSGVRLLVRETGGRTPVLLAHGMWCEGGMFVPLAAQLGRTFRLIIPDLRGHGRSGIPNVPWSIPDLANDIRAILDTTGVTRAVVAGFSMGGMAAIHFALANPERVRALVLMSTSAGPEAAFRRFQISLLEPWLRVPGARNLTAQVAARAAFSPKFRRTSPKIVEEWERQVREMPAAALVQAADAIAHRPSMLSRLEELRIPTLIVTGSRDVVLAPRSSKEMHRRIAGSRLAVLRGAGHVLPVERPERTAALIQELLAEAKP